MAVFRSDQAQVTFAAEAAQGGDFERLGASVDTSSYLYISANPGDLSITVAAGTGYRVGDFIRIGNTANAANSEVRRVEYINGGVLLEEDVPEEFKYFGRSPLDLIFSVNLDYLVCIALIKYGKREEVPLEHQLTYKKVKSIKPNSDRL